MGSNKVKIGMRTIKTGLAVMLGVTVAESVGLRSPLFVAIGAISTMQTSVSESFVMGKNRILGTIMGAVVAVAIAEILPYSNIFLGLGIILLIQILNILGWRKSISLSAIVFSAVYLNKEMGMIEYATNRVIDTFIGIVMGVLVNYLVATPDSEKKFYAKVDAFVEVAKEYTYSLIVGKKTVNLENLRSMLSDIEKLQDLVRGDSNILYDNEGQKLDTAKTLRILEEIFNDLSSITAMDYMAIVSSKNLILAGQVFQITPIWYEKSIISEEDIIFNYHLQRLLKNLYSM
ncbi:aromatic acid exporter family protein [Gudongella oleilytica]|uniref:FUSC family protein n=1 Tax=Gudongella oleilytica TaxID=1582259 RepID=UPI002A359C69|nr:aromatic acid exporter family protein [Gudongella oleilytica]MDY0256704.1 aromatic acid exporter family protein [Gudongella oleilytica]